MARERFDGLMPVYTVFPKAMKGFLDLYQLTISRIHLNRISQAFEEIYTHKDGAQYLRKLQLEIPDLLLVLKKLLGAPESEQDICIRWLRGGDVDKKLLRSIGIGKALSGSEEAIAVLCSCIEVLNKAAALSGHQDIRLIWLLDEYQRIKNCRPSVRDEINTSIHSVFNRSPKNLSIIISFSGRPEEKRWPEWLSPEIRDRIGIMANVLVLPPLGATEALEFVRDVLRFFRPPGTNCADFFPFTEESTREILKLMKEKKVELKPRAIMHFFTAVLEQAEKKLEEGILKAINVEFTRDVLRKHSYMEIEI